ncbi:gas vesicle protein [Candidatus Poribacteria bacterium]|nr:gas vesicle protein [Candidatus Poribacteria bacterium]
MQDNITHSVQSTSLADILERILDKGIVIAGDIRIQIADIDLLNIKIRLMVASVERAKEMGIDWWESDPYLSSKVKKLEEENQQLNEKLISLTKAVA